MSIRTRFFAAIVGFLIATGVPVATATAQSSDIPADFKGVVGLGLIGAELGMVIPAIAGMDDTWAYLVFPTVGMIGGGVAGYFLLESGNHTSASIAMLGVGMALVIPSVILTLSLTAYDPDDHAPSAAAQGSRPASAQRGAARVAALQRAGNGLVRVSDGRLAFGAPAVGPVASVALNGRPSVRLGASDFQVALLTGSF